MLLNIATAARKLGVSASAVRLWVRTGRVKATRDGRGWAFVEEAEVERLRRERRKRRPRRVFPRGELSEW